MFHKRRGVLWPAERLSVYDLYLGYDVTHEYNHDANTDVYKFREKCCIGLGLSLKNTPPSENDINKEYAESFFRHILS
jgi:hypothetical protein